MDFGVAQKFGGVCNLRMDDTNPQKEDHEYVEAIKRDIEWLGYHWGKILYASDYFGDLWEFAVALIKQGRAYVDEQSSDRLQRRRARPHVPARPVPIATAPWKSPCVCSKK